MGQQSRARFGRYELISRLGRGGMAVTWRARLLGEAGVTKPVLIKKILPEYANDDAFISMFISEARISATLSHGNIAQVYDFGRVDDEYFLAMEFVDGQPLNRIIKRALQSGLTSIPVPLATFIAMEMCRGLHYAHTRKDDSGRPLGIVHRDISPDNVLVSYEGQVKIVDFGIAKARELRGFNTEPGVVKGKYLFFSPEQARGEMVDARTDVWATGIVLYEMLCGQLPVKGPQYVALPRLLSGDFPRARELNPAIPEELDDIVARSLELVRELRIGSSNELADALAGFLYATEPRFSAMSVAHFVQDLFREDLESTGRSVELPASFRKQLASWKSTEVPTQAAPRAGPPATAAPQASAPASNSRTTLLWGAGLGVVLAVTLLALAVSFTSEPPSLPPEAVELRKLGPPNAGTAAPVPQPPPAPTASAPEPTPALEPAPPAPVPLVSVVKPSWDLPRIQLPLARMEPSSSADENARRAADRKGFATRYLDGGRFKEAAAFAEQCLQLDPKHAGCYEILSTAEHYKGEPEKAVEAYKAYLRLKKKNPNSPEAKEHLQRLSVIPTTRPEILAPGAPLNAIQQAKVKFADAMSLMSARKFSKALVLGQECVELDPQNAECYLLLGSCLTSLKRYDEAALEFRTFLRLAPDHMLAPKAREFLEMYDRSDR